MTDNKKKNEDLDKLTTKQLFENVNNEELITSTKIVDIMYKLVDKENVRANGYNVTLTVDKVEVVINYSDVIDEERFKKIKNEYSPKIVSGSITDKNLRNEMINYLLYLLGLNDLLNRFTKDDASKGIISELKTADGNIINAMKGLEDAIKGVIDNKTKEKFIKSLYELQVSVLVRGVSKLRDVMKHVLNDIEKQKEYKNEPTQTEKIPDAQLEKIKENIKKFVEALTDKNNKLKDAVRQQTLNIEENINLHNIEILQEQNRFLDAKQKQQNELKQSESKTGVNSSSVTSSRQLPSNPKSAASSTTKQGGSRTNYKQKYLKYKTKYLHLKSSS